VDVLEIPGPDEIAAEMWRRGRLDYKRHAGQTQLTEAFRKIDATWAIIHAARGKTFDALLDCFEHALSKRFRRIVFAAPTREEAKKIVNAVAPMITHDAPAGIKPIWMETHHQFYFPSTGSVVIVEGADDERGNHLRGPHIHLCICDEAGFWRHCRYVIRSVLLPQVQRVGGRMRVQSTSPESVGHEFVGLCDEAIRNDAYFKFTIHDNPRMTPEKIQKDAEEVSGKKGADVWKDTSVRREFLCEFVTDVTRAVLPEFDQDIHVGEAERPRFVDCYLGLDLGLVDLTHCLFGFWDFDNARLVIEDELVGQYMRTAEFAELCKAKEKAIWGEIEYFGAPPILPNGKTAHNRCPWARYSDNEAQQLYDLAGMGLSFAPAIKTDKEAAINRLRQLFATGKILIHPRCARLLHQIRVGIWNERRTDYERLPGAGHLDGIDALVYMARMIDRNRNPNPPMLGIARATHHWTDNKKHEKHPMAGIVRR
jgi:hypothetical protein